ncbi:MAG: hypothetical protein KME47_26725 [Nodosilinea sp. WJT8-NPBG4]|nr:hypothetical protein [Nodosilinea sp. WJT8-NPBG4]
MKRVSRLANVYAGSRISVFGQKVCSIHVQEMTRALYHQRATVELFAT